MEDGKEQCAEYIPLDGTECKDYGAVRVRVLEKPKHVLSLKKVVRTKLQITYAGVSHEVRFDFLQIYQLFADYNYLRGFVHK